MTEPKSTPTADQTREQLIVRWREARRQREAATPGSVAYRRALEEIARIEVDIARIERAMDPPRA
jgi:ribosomal protein L18E